MKIAGAVIIILGSAALGFALSASSAEACAAAEEIYRTMRYIRDEICENRTPTDIILLRLGVVFSGAAGADRIYTAYEKKLSRLNEKEKSIFREFCSAAGKGGAGVQRGAFDALLSRYEAELETRRRKNSSAPKLYIASALFFGVFAVIIFL
jgi:hypothetical protein